ncbi:hypothetical protein KUCAC02_032140 [Chaenocephalus aceratus]|nr:hypothetical protein KUCAC02_032140 [Chaenocephalus aceratus]
MLHAFMLLLLRKTGANGTPHLQGFMNLKTKVRLSQVKAFVTTRAHLEQAKGTDKDNETYCSKDGDIYLAIGTPSAQGKRSDIDAAVEILKSNGGNMFELAQQLPSVYIRYGRGFNQWVDTARIQKPRDWKTNVTVYEGPPGCGKSCACAEAFPAGENVYYKTRGEWWDGYSGQETVIMDDFYGWMKYDEMLCITDRYPHRVPIKGGFVQFLAKNICITSNSPVSQWYKFETFDPTALMRRINVYKVWCHSTNAFIDFNACPAYNPTVPYNY